MPGDEHKQRWVLSFKELEKGLVLNTTTIRVLEKAFGKHTDRLAQPARSRSTSTRTCSFKGQVVGGLRVRPQKAKATKAADGEEAAAGGFQRRNPGAVTAKASSREIPRRGLLVVRAGSVRWRVRERMREQMRVVKCKQWEILDEDDNPRKAAALELVARGFSRLCGAERREAAGQVALAERPPRRNDRCRDGGRLVRREAEGQHRHRMRQKGRPRRAGR